MAKFPVKLAPHKLSTETLQHRQRQRLLSHKDNIPRVDLYYFDFKALFCRLLKSNITKTMFCGLMEWQDKADALELWQSYSWGSSNKTTSGVFAYTADRNPIFVSDFVKFYCNNTHCFCAHKSMHIGRVCCVGINCRKSEVNSCAYGKIEVQIQECLYSDDAIFHSCSALQPPLDVDELVLTSQFYFVTEDQIVAVEHGGADIALDYVYADERINVKPVHHSGLFLRRSINTNVLESSRQIPYVLQETPLCYQALLRGELEIKAHGRGYFISLAQMARQQQCYSLPYLTFIDGAVHY